MFSLCLVGFLLGSFILIKIQKHACRLNASSLAVESVGFHHYGRDIRFQAISGSGIIVNISVSMTMLCVHELNFRDISFHIVQGCKCNDTNVMTHNHFKAEIILAA